MMGERRGLCHLHTRGPREGKRQRRGWGGAHICVCYNVMHEAGENDDEKIGRERAPLSDASLLDM